MRCYEQELKKPVRNLINGELARSLLIQVQQILVFFGLFDQLLYTSR